MAFTTKSYLVIAELVHAVDECSILLHRSCEYYREMEMQFKGNGFVKSTLPSQEEISFMQEKWRTFTRNVGNLKGGFSYLHARLLTGPDIHNLGSSYGPSESGTIDIAAKLVSGLMDD